MTLWTTATNLLLPKPCTHNDGWLVEVWIGHPWKVSRKLFLAPRNPRAQWGRNLWHVESNWGIFICINPFFYCPIFSKKHFLKLKFNYFSGFQSPEVRKLPNFWVWFFVCSQNYGRITKYFGFHIFTFCIFWRKFTIFEKIERIRQFFCIYWKHNSRQTFLCWHVQLQAVCIIEQWPSPSIL